MVASPHLGMRARLESGVGVAGGRTPCLQMSGWRALLSLLALASSVLQVTAAISSLHDRGCLLVGSYVLLVGILSIILLVSLQLLPLLADRRSRPLVLLRRAWWCLLGLLMPTFFVMNILGGLWVHSDNCWDRQWMRDLAVFDVVGVFVLMIVAGWYAAEHLIRPSELWRKRFKYKRHLVRLALFFQRNGRALLLLLCLTLTTASVYRLCEYNTMLVQSYHWSFSDRPAACQKSCHEKWRPNKRARKCMNARNEVIPIQHCLDNLAPLEMLPSNHLMLQQCPTLMCKYPNGERLRFHWSMRNEHTVRAQECTKHDRRMVEQVALVQEFGCFDERQKVWVDERWCAASAPPFSNPDRPERDAFRLLYWKDKHCLHRCDAVVRLTWLSAGLAATAAISLAISMLGQRFHQQMVLAGAFTPAHHARALSAAAIAAASSSSSSSSSAASTTTLASVERAHSSQETAGLLDPSPMPLATSSSSFASSSSSSVAFAGRLDPSAPDLLYLRHHVHAGNVGRWAVVRLARWVYYLHVYGLCVLPFAWRLAARSCLALGLVGLTCHTLRVMLWLADSHCRFFTLVAMANGGTIFVAFAVGLIWTIRHLEQTKETHQAMSTLRGIYASQTKEEAYEDR